MHKRKVSNLYKIVLNFNLSNTRSILANGFFGNISFANNGNDQKNSTSGTIHKSSNQIPKTKINIKYKPIKKEPQEGKKKNS